MLRFTLVKCTEVEEGLTQASICQAGSIRVHSNSVFAKFLSFKSFLSNPWSWRTQEKHTSRLGQTSNGKLGHTVRRNHANTCSYDVSRVFAYCDCTRQLFLPAPEHAPEHPQSIRARRKDRSY